VIKDMQFVIRIVGGNAAFEDNPGELTRIIRDCARKIDNGQWTGKLMDLNGNTTGIYGFK
jgi:hypothetical protein